MTKDRAIYVLLGLTIVSCILFFVYYSYFEAFGSSEQLIEGIKYKVTIHDGIGTNDNLE